MEIIAKINISTPNGRKIARRLAAEKKDVEIMEPLPEGFENAKTLDAVFDDVWKSFEQRYGYNPDPRNK